MSRHRDAVEQVQLRRIYDPPSADDGVRVLVDRLWPRGLSKAEAAIDRWMKDVAPSAELRTWFGHEPDRWPEFRTRYIAELRQNPAVDELRELVRDGRVTLLFGARDAEHNNAVVLREVLLQGRRSQQGAER
jgi:uncharacterized protein YeaO (DUF488 family)